MLSIEKEVTISSPTTGLSVTTFSIKNSGDFNRIDITDMAYINLAAYSATKPSKNCKFAPHWVECDIKCDFYYLSRTIKP